jgi:solute carrier family 25 phosphate transporter 23/24/25/41
MLKFPLNEYYRGIFGINTFENLLKSGISAGLTQTIITYPLDMMRTRMSLDNKMTNNYNGYYRSARNIILNEGFRALYKGCLINFTTYPLYVGLQFSIYDSCKEEYGIFSGTIAGVIAQSLMFPGDTIKRQMQINGLDNSGKKIKGLIDCIKYIFRNLGILGFYQGYYINMIKVVPEATIQFMTYDFISKILATYTSRK